MKNSFWEVDNVMIIEILKSAKNQMTIILLFQYYKILDSNKEEYFIKFIDSVICKNRN